MAITPPLRVRRRRRRHQVLTLASSVTVDVQGNAFIQGSASSGDGIVNQGVINQTGSFGNLQIGALAFTNSGTIEANAMGGNFDISPVTFTNSGTLDIATAEEFIIDPTTFTTTASSLIEIGTNSSITEPSNDWSNLGTITLAGGAVLTSLSFTNDGVLERSGGTGTSLIESKVTNAGTIEVSSGALELRGVVAGKGTDTISGGSTLQFGRGVSSAKTLGDQDIDFSAGGGALHLLAPTSFYGEISDFGTGDTVELRNPWEISGISHAGGVTTLTLLSDGTAHGFEFVGHYARSNFAIVSGTTTKIEYQT